MLDKDRSKTISRGELKNLFETSEKKDDALWNEIFAEVDVDGDGEITFDEFKYSMLKVIKNTKGGEDKYLIRTDTVDRHQMTLT